jgi:Arc/MetJ-type ribon-helix-helix transcriptional regulator
MAAPVTVRLGKDTRQCIARIARRKRVSASEVIREAIEAYVERQDAGRSPYEAVADLIGVVHGGNPKRSADTGRQLTELLTRRRSRS